MLDWKDYLQLLAALAITLGLIYVVLRHVLPRLQFGKPAADGLIRVRATYPLEPRKTLYIVEAGSETLLLGSSGDTLSTLGSIPRESLPVEIPVAPTRFADLLKRRRA